MKFDFHLHTTRYSGCSRMTPKERVRATVARGRHDIVITEHDTAWSARGLVDLRQLAPHPVILTGMERSCRERHFLVSSDLNYDRLLASDCAEEVTLR